LKLQIAKSEEVNQPRAIHDVGSSAKAQTGQNTTHSESTVSVDAQQESTSQQTSSDGPSHWVLRPRRGHSALNSGIKSLEGLQEILLVAWPGDLKLQEETAARDLSFKDLSEAEKVGLENGLWDLGEKDAIENKGGIRCKPVWISDQVGVLFDVDVWHSQCMTLTDFRKLLRWVLQKVRGFLDDLFLR
jgi:hypothetical protein